MKPLLVTLGLLAGAAPAAAQFDLFTWVLDNPGGGIASVTPEGMGIHGTPWQVPGSIIKYTTVSHIAGLVTVQSSVWPEDGFCGGGGSLALHYGDDGVGDVYATCTWFGTLQDVVWEGSSFGYGLQTIDTSWPYSVTLEDLQFTPTWTDQGGVLAGGAGDPKLGGQGALVPGHAIGVQLNGAAPLAPVTLVVGQAVLGAPFKGGTMVPTVEILVPGLLTDAGGSLSLSTTWPGGIPAGFEVFLQAWIADASGPAGFAASNGLRGVVF